MSESGGIGMSENLFAGLFSAEPTFEGLFGPGLEGWGDAPMIDAV